MPFLPPNQQPLKLRPYGAIQICLLLLLLFKALKATVRHRLQWFIHVQADSLRKEDEPALLMVCDTFLCVVVTVMSLAV